MLTNVGGRNLHKFPEEICISKTTRNLHSCIISNYVPLLIARILYPGAAACFLLMKQCIARALAMVYLSDGKMEAWIIRMLHWTQFLRRFPRDVRLDGMQQVSKGCCDFWGPVKERTVCELLCLSTLAMVATGNELTRYFSVFSCSGKISRYLCFLSLAENVHYH